MGDKWMTSGAWRLKEKQSRTFAARQRQSQARTQNDTSVPSIIMTGGSRETKVRNHKRRLRSNGSGTGGYSAYADPVIQRGIVVSLCDRDEKLHPEHPKRTARRIRDPKRRSLPLHYDIHINSNDNLDEYHRLQYQDHCHHHAYQQYQEPLPSPTIPKTQPSPLVIPEYSDERPPLTELRKRSMPLNTHVEYRPNRYSRTIKRYHLPGMESFFCENRDNHNNDNDETHSLSHNDVRPISYSNQPFFAKPHDDKLSTSNHSFEEDFFGPPIGSQAVLGNSFAKRQHDSAWIQPQPVCVDTDWHTYQASVHGQGNENMMSRGINRFKRGPSKATHTFDATATYSHGNESEFSIVRQCPEAWSTHGESHFPPNLDGRNDWFSADTPFPEPENFLKTRSLPLNFDDESHFQRSSNKDYSSTNTRVNKFQGVGSLWNEFLQVEVGEDDPTSFNSSNTAIFLQESEKRQQDVHLRERFCHPSQRPASEYGRLPSFSWSQIDVPYEYSAKNTSVHEKSCRSQQPTDFEALLQEIRNSERDDALFSATCLDESAKSNNPAFSPVVPNRFYSDATDVSPLDESSCHADTIGSAEKRQDDASRNDILDQKNDDFDAILVNQKTPWTRFGI